MNTKHIEQTHSEEFTSELFDIAYTDRADDLVTSSLSKPYAQASGTEEVKGDFTSYIIELPATLKVFVRKLFSAPAKVFGGKSMVQMFSGVREAYDWLKERVKGSDGIPKKELPEVEDAAHLVENLHLLDSRKVDVGELDCQDGVDLIQLFGTKGFADSIEHVVVGREDAVYERNLTNLMSYFSGAKSITLKGHATMSCAGWSLPSSVEEFTYEGEYIYDDNVTGTYPVFVNGNCKQFNFPNLRVISRKGSTGGGSESLVGSSVPWSISLPKLESVRYLNGMTASGYEVASVSNPILELPSLKEIRNSGSFPLTRRHGYCGFTQLICPNLETVLDSTLAIGHDGNPLELYYAPKLKNINPNGQPFPTHHYDSDYKTTLYPNLIDAWVGEINVSMTLQYWGCANIINDEEKTATLNKNIREHIAARIADRTGQTALTVTFLDLVYAKLEPETIAAFTQKNWTVASKSA